MQFTAFEPLAFSAETIYVNEPIPGYVPVSDATSDFLARSSGAIERVESAVYQVSALNSTKPAADSSEYASWKQEMISLVHDLLTSSLPAVGVPLYEQDAGYASHHDTLQELMNALVDFCQRIRFVEDVREEILKPLDEGAGPTVLQNKYFFLVLDLQRLERDIANDVEWHW